MNKPGTHKYRGVFIDRCSDSENTGDGYRWAIWRPGVAMERDAQLFKTIPEAKKYIDIITETAKIYGWSRFDPSRYDMTDTV